MNWGYWEFQRKRKKVVVMPNPKNKQLPTVDQITGKKIPQSFVFSRKRLPPSLRQLEMDLRKLMLPYTALKLKVLILSQFLMCVNLISLYPFVV